MRKIIVLFVLITYVSAWGNTCYAYTELDLFDLSGSLVDARPLLACNFEMLDKGIDSFGKADRVIVLGFRSKGSPWLIAEKQFSKQWGPRKINIIGDRRELRRKLKHSFRNPPARLRNMGGSTDLTGSINLGLLHLSDQADPDDTVKLKIFSDGLHSTNGVGSLLHLKDVKPYSLRVKKANGYLVALEKHLMRTRLATPPRLDQIIWYGKINDDDLGLLATDLGLLSSRLRQLWVAFLQRELKGAKVIYKLNYSMPSRASRKTVSPS